MGSSAQLQELRLPPDRSSVAKDGDVPIRKRGRPPIALTEEVLERRRLSMQRVNASRPRDGDAPARKRGRPPIAVSDEVLERRRLSRQRVNASRPGRDDTSPKRGRPRHVQSESAVEAPASSRGEIHGLQPQEPEPNGMVNVIHDSANHQSTSSGQGRRKLLY